MCSVTIVGAGLMGAQIGAEYALGGHTVTLVTRSASSASASRRRAVDALAFLAETGLADADATKAAQERLRTGTDLRQACAGAAVAVESIPEQFEAKVDILRQVAAAAPADAVIASNTSSLSIAHLGQAAGIPERMIGTHYWNPPTLMPLVELVTTAATAPRLVERMVALLRTLGKDPVVIRDALGFVWNRLQLALLREAASLVSQGIADAETVDLVIRRGLARRWSVVGPFQSIALGGPATFAAVGRLLFPELRCDVDPELLRTITLRQAPPAAEAARRRNLALARWLQADRRQQDIPG